MTRSVGSIRRGLSVTNSSLPDIGRGSTGNLSDIRNSSSTSSSSTSSVITVVDNPAYAEQAQVTQFLDGVTVRYACAAGSAPVTSIDILYDYEFVVPTPLEPLPWPEVLSHDVPKLDFGILRRMALLIGLTPICSVDLLQNQTRKELPSGSYVVGLSSLPPDQLDAIGNCTFIKDVPKSLLCIPMIGRITAEYVGNSSEAIRQYVLRLLNQEMSAQSVLAGQTTEIFFVGERIRNVPSSGDTKPIQGPPSESSSTLLAPLVSTISAVGLVLFFAVFVFRRKRRRDDQKEPHSSSIKNVLPLDHVVKVNVITEGSSASGAGTSDAQHSSGRSTADTTMKGPTKTMEPDELPPLNPRDVSGRSERVLLLASTSRPNEEDSVQTTEATTATSSSSSVSSESKEKADPPSPHRPGTDLPPLPPVPLSSKSKAAAAVLQTMKKKRKKKKMKKRKIERVNSRENVPGMETIAEGPDELIEDDGSGSEYSWYSDDTESHPGSRDASPSPSLNRDGSSTGSPPVVENQQTDQQQSQPQERKKKNKPPPQWV